MNPHKGHRERLRERFLAEGLDNFPEHNILELLLFYALPQKDTNPIAHALLTEFGSLAGVLDAPLEELCKVSGVGQNAAVLIKLLPPFWRRYQMSRTAGDDCLDTIEKAGAYLLPRFFGLKTEQVYVLCLDAKCKLLVCKKLFEGIVNAAQIHTRRVVELALACNASSVILAHNHLSGVALPSHDDRVTTLRLKEALESVGVFLADHIIVAEEDFVSMAQSGW